MPHTHLLAAHVAAEFSPDDQGWYLVDLETGNVGSPVRYALPVWTSLGAARSAFLDGEVTWA